MLELGISLKGLSGWQHTQGVCATVKYCHYLFGGGGEEMVWQWTGQEDSFIIWYL